MSILTPDGPSLIFREVLCLYTCLPDALREVAAHLADVGHVAKVFLGEHVLDGAGVAYQLRDVAQQERPNVVAELVGLFGRLTVGDGRFVLEVRFAMLRATRAS